MACPDHLVTVNDVRALMGVLQTDTASKGLFRGCGALGMLRAGFQCVAAIDFDSEAISGTRCSRAETIPTART